MHEIKLVTTLAVLSVLVGCANDPNRSAGRQMDDRAISGRISDALDDSPVYKFPHVHVSTYNGVVQLSGFVNRDEQKAAATEAARNTPGVTQVINNISVLPAEAAMGATRAQPSRSYGSETYLRTNEVNRAQEPDIRK